MEYGILAVPIVFVLAIVLYGLVKLSYLFVD
jgi:hypothetical protein